MRFPTIPAGGGRAAVATATTAAFLLVAACGNGSSDTSPTSASPGASGSAGSATPTSGEARVTDVMTGLDHPWDVAIDGDGNIVTGERSGRIMMRHNDGRVAQVQADTSGVDAKGEAGFMGLALADDFAQSRSVYTCFASTAGDVRVVRWTAAADWSSMRQVADVVTGIPLGSSGRHSGCRILPAADGTLFVSTGDTANPTAPQDLKNLGGKVLHVNADGTPAAGTFEGSIVYDYGHRNPQGLAFAPGTDRLYVTEHGPDIDDELNQVLPQANYGWDPNTGSGSYDESVPMTDTDRHPGSTPAIWSSGDPTLAISDVDFLGPAWGRYSGMVVMGALKAKRLVLLRLGADGTTTTERVDLLDDAEGRLRSITPMPDGSLLVTTDNGGGQDKVLKVSPA
ncbi:PQQ-dependent sugar dehydrogenase [Williamsia maris]|uniref:Glucose/arabinose dehydrogenase, beta-propeller fold n=1 Tax=Williamsia maris TaxID=72806 RepID=A0ABT1HGN7_9NOCA|nr:PQQ-dependent sugar dehydrogenase [Williamsia maris]MCP2177354.1 Glucose/arabinose dehydrogenase, beta-propeller fold [Williamsia maris]